MRISGPIEIPIKRMEPEASLDFQLVDLLPPAVQLKVHKVEAFLEI